MKSSLLQPRDTLDLLVPAFPTITVSIGHESGIRTEGGMDLRDYFATRALVVAFAHLPEYKGKGWKELAHTAFAIADEMMIARKDYE